MRLILALALVASVSGCATMQPVEPTANCSSWNDEPYNFGQKEWRAFDCFGDVTHKAD